MSHSDRADGFAAVDLTAALRPSFSAEKIPLQSRYDDTYLSQDSETLDIDSPDLPRYQSHNTSGVKAVYERVSGRVRWTARKWLRNPLVVLIGLIVALVLIIIVSSADALGDDSEAPGKDGSGLPPVTLDDIFAYKFGPDYANYRWVPGMEGHHSLRAGENIILRHVEHGNETILVASPQDSNGNKIPFRDYFISSEANYVLLETQYEKGWRHGFFAEYWIWDVENKVATPLTSSKSDKTIPGEIGSGKVGLAVWSPQDESIAWVRDNDLYVTVDTKTEVRITTDGSKNVINGIADWVYEEEVLGSHDALWFSPNGTRVAYLKFNETNVPEVKLEYYEKHKSGSKYHYPEEVSLKYPKAGAPNPIVTLHVATPAGENSTELDATLQFSDGEYFADEDRLIVEVVWMHEDALLARMTNRVQDIERLFLITPDATHTGVWKARLVREHVLSDGGWVTRLQPITPVPPSKAVGRQNPSYIELKENNQGWTHLAYFASVDDKEPTTWVTSGNWDVVEVVGVNAEKGVVYYISTEGGPGQRHLFSVHLDGSDKVNLTPLRKDVKPIVPRLEFQPNNTRSGDAFTGDAVGYYAASFSPKCTYYILHYRGPDIPVSTVHKTTSSWSASATDNAILRERLPQYAYPRKTYFQIPLDAQNATFMNAVLQVPHDFDPTSSKKYPVLMKVYNGPNSQLVSRTYSADFMASITSTHGVVTLTVDGRGTGYMSRPFRTAVSRRLGTLEVQDQLLAAKWIAQQPYIDASRIAVWGWSYGGYVTTKIVEANIGADKVFRTAMAVAPVTDWRYYDSIYTERFMGTVVGNGDGYEKSAVRNMTAFRETPFLLVHGTADDNVHFQNTASLIYRLTSAHIRNYKVQVYTDGDHSMNAGGANKEVYYLLRDWIGEAFGQ
ncbi:dipeptidyl peptidase IV N-terminal region-domain-containing protein [Gaertneriomyces semiglobifer]|nr:dipeptidyl peptidase IV N-terminal region-domain-containing protein [Gaertneriomyces semiglobifer]